MRWVKIDAALPDEQELTTVRVHGAERRHYYRIGERWYWMGDLNRWQMNTSPFWSIDRSWYLKTEQIEGWWPED